MAGFLSKLFGLQDSVDFATLITDGAVILDVRTKEEYRQGHSQKSVNIPLDNLQQSLSKLNKESVIIAVCASGMRSKVAVSILKRGGFDKVYNGGSWADFE